MSKYVIGIDVGGTNTDIVLRCEDQILATAKSVTTKPITKGIQAAIQELLRKAKVAPKQIQFIMLGTTHLLNATLQNKLNRVGVVRLGAPASTGIPPCIQWPDQIKNSVVGFIDIIKGGFEYHGEPISELDPKELQKIAEKAKAMGIKYIALSGIFAHIRPDQEQEAAKILKQYNPDLEIFLSQHASGNGLLSRENATALNAALKNTYDSICSGLCAAMHEIGLTNAKIFISRNDGTVEPIADQQQAQSLSMPVYTLNAGPTNSIRGAAILAKQHKIPNAVVIDIGGTSTDRGFLKDGKPLESNQKCEVAGIPLDISSLRTASIALGGTSIVDMKAKTIGPNSLGYQWEEQSVSRGGNVITPTDIAIMKGRLNIENCNIKLTASPELDQIDLLYHQQLAEFVLEGLASNQIEVNILILTGGGSKTINKDLLLRNLQGKITEILIFEEASVANALGASYGKISGTCTVIAEMLNIDVKKSKKEEIIAKAIAQAIANGASEGANEVVAENDFTFEYVAGNLTSMTVKVAGEPASNTSKSSLTLKAESTTIQKQHSTHIIDLEDIQSMPQIPSSPEFILKMQMIKAFAAGFAFFGSGGGGDTKLLELILRKLILAGKDIELTQLEKLLNDAFVLALGFMGSPGIFEERLFAEIELTNAIRAAKEHYKQEPDAYVTFEGGGANGFTAIIAAMLTGKIIVDGDYMGRAFPGLTMTTPCINKNRDEFSLAMGGLKETHIVTNSSLSELEGQAGALAMKMGGVAACAGFLMKGKAVKEVCIPSTLSIAKRIGEVYLNSEKKEVITNLDKALKDTTYEYMKNVCSGRIVKVSKINNGRFDFGYIFIQTDDNRLVEIIFKNEFLALRVHACHGVIHTEVEVPDIIDVLDQNNLFPIQCTQLVYGQNVTVVRMAAPKEWRTEPGLKIVGSEAQKIGEMIDEIKKNQSYNPSFFTQGMAGSIQTGIADVQVATYTV